MAGPTGSECHQLISVAVATHPCRQANAAGVFVEDEDALELEAGVIGVVTLCRVAAGEVGSSTTGRKVCWVDIAGCNIAARQQPLNEWYWQAWGPAP